MSQVAEIGAHAASQTCGSAARAVVRSPRRWLIALAVHWLALANVAVLLFVALPLAAPLLMASGFTGVADAIYGLYANVCHQWPFRSFFLFGPQGTYSFDALVGVVGTGRVYSLVGSPELGYKVAFCERDLALYAAILVSGLVFALRRARARPLSFLVYVLVCVPIAVDGFTQLFGWRESSWELRLLTGALFGAATVWFIYPRLDRVLAEAGLGRPAPAAVKTDGC